MAKAFEVTVVVPCYNEEDSLPPLLVRLDSLIATANLPWKVVFVNDGSRDRTGAILDQIAKDRPWISVIHHPHNQGLGAGLRTGFAVAATPIVCTIDSDCTYPPERLPDLIAALDRGADIATASPWHPDAESGDVTPVRRSLSVAASMLYRVVIGQRIHTFTCMFRAYKRPVLDKIQFQSTGFPAVTELLVKAILAGFKVAEIPMPLGARRFGESKMSLGQAITGHLELLSKCLIWRIRA